MGNAKRIAKHIVAEDATLLDESLTECGWCRDHVLTDDDHWDEGDQAFYCDNCTPEFRAKNVWTTGRGWTPRTAVLTGRDRCPVCGDDTDLAGWGRCHACESDACAGCLETRLCCKMARQ